MSTALLSNPRSVSWSHSDSTADFYELPTDGQEMHEALGWLLQHYDGVKLWMGHESEEGAELYLTATPSRMAEVVDRLQVYHDQLDLFEAEPTAVGE